jgi:hypothetical protein
MAITEWLKEATPDRAVVGVCLDRELLSDLQAAEKELTEAKAQDEGQEMLGEPSESKARIEALSGRVEELRKEAEAKTRTLVFESIGRRRWADLLSEHPPSKEDKQQFGEEIDHNPATFPIHALAASCTEPGMTVEEAEELQDFLPVAVWTRLVAACFSVNIVGSRDPFGNGFAAALPSGPRSRRRPN